MAHEAAKAGDKVSSDPAADTHNCTMPNNSVTSSACTFSAIISDKLSANVFIGDQAAATKNSVAAKQVKHDPSLPATATQIEPLPKDSGKITNGSQTVSINNLAAARAGDAAECCSVNGTVVVEGTSTVFIGD